MEAALGWRDNDAMASLTMVSWPMVVAAVVVVVVSCAAAICAAATIPSSAYTVLAKMPSLLPQSTAASIEDN